MDTVLLVGSSVVVAWLLAATIRRRLGFLTRVESVSMVPSLTPGQRVLARRPRDRDAVRRGDIVVVDSVELGRPIVKRVVGLPGEHVEVVADGRVLVEGRPLEEPYVVHRGGPGGTFEVPVGHLLLLGDNRAGSSDARVWRQPFVPVGAVLGRLSRQGRPAAAGAPDPAPPRRAAVRAGSHRRVAATPAGG